ncbi:hypothetical protein GCM10027089_51260 [Nocardia thraciensis]
MRRRSGAGTLLSRPLADAPDLVDAREQFPHLASLWDQVHNDFWNTYGRQIDRTADASGRRVQ